MLTHPEPQGAYLGYGDLAPRFNLVYDGSGLLEEVIRQYRQEKGLPESEELGSGLREPDRAMMAAVYGARLTEELESCAAGFRVSIQPVVPSIQIEGSEIGVCGPGAPDLVTIYGFAVEAAQQLETWAMAAVGVAAVLRRLEKASGRRAALDTGTAAMEAARVIFETGQRDLTLAFSVEVSGAIPTEEAPERHDGFAVGFRNESSLTVVLMGIRGENPLVTSMRLPWARSRRGA